MERNMLDGWLALAAETRRVDRLSSTLGREYSSYMPYFTLLMRRTIAVDTPSFQNSPSSLGSSSGSSGLNTPSQNAFRFLPLLKDILPELLKSSSLDFVRAHIHVRGCGPKENPRYSLGRIGAYPGTLIKGAFIAISAECQRTATESNSISSTGRSFARFVRRCGCSITTGLEVSQIITRTSLSCRPSSGSHQYCASWTTTLNIFKSPQVLSCLASTEARPTPINRLQCQCISLDFIPYLWGPDISTRLSAECNRFSLCRWEHCIRV
jgi:hypothetical protein